MLAVHNVSPASQRVNTTKSVSKHCSSDSDSDAPIYKHKRFKLDTTNYCGLESHLREMNVETENGEISPEEMVNSTPSFLSQFGSNRKRNANSFNSSSPLRSQFAASSSQSSSPVSRSKATTQQQRNSLFDSRKQQPNFNTIFNTNQSTPTSTSTSKEYSSVKVDSTLKRVFEKKYNYKRRLRHLPSQEQNQQLSPTSISLKNLNNRVHLADALAIMEEMLMDKEEKLREEFHLELQNKLAEQYEQFVRYNEDAVRSKLDNSCSYLS